MAVFEIVPNLSEGRDLAIVDRAAEAATRGGARVLHRTSDAMHHRSVLTIAGDERAVLEAAIAVARIAFESIDLREHSGVHPRIGALDVLPFVPLQGASMEQAVRLAHEAGSRIWNEFNVPCYFYGAAARSPERAPLPSVRSGRFEPDLGSGRHERSGAVAIGARPVLIALNVELTTTDLEAGREIAAALRERGGGFRSLRALAFPLADGRIQVSMNVTEPEATPLHRIVETIRRLAGRRGIGVLRSELIGCLPQAAVEAAARYYLGVPDQ
jgi:glutamate formiminotransferase